MCSLLLLASPLGTAADESTSLIGQELPLGILAQAVVTEVQTGSAARADEYIEIFNPSDEPLDVTGWQLRYITASESSTKTVEDPSSIIAFTAVASGSPLLIPAQGHYLFYSGAVSLPTGTIGQLYDGLLPATGGSLVLVRPDSATCELVVEDALAWGATTHLFGEGDALTHGTSSSKDRLFQRYIGADTHYVDTSDNAEDFAAGDAVTSAGLATPGVRNQLLLPEIPVAGSGSASQQLPDRFVNADCTLPEPPVDPPVELPESPPSTTIPPEGEDEENEDPLPTIPAANVGLKTPQLSEVLPNPASPQTDAEDEFIELYNPNDTRFDLSGYVLEVGLTTKRRYSIPVGTFIEGRSFRAFFSADTRLALSNSGGQAHLIDPLGSRLAQTEPYGTAKDGQAWLLANGVWQWTTRPTPNALNTVSTPVVKPASTAKSKSTAKTAVAGKTSQPKTTEAAKDVETAAAVVATTSTPLHPSVLALIGVSALLYGAYEYRRDVANRIYQFRSNRAARAALRQSTKGR